MSPDLSRTLEIIGWESLYEERIPNLGPVTPRGERRAISPFPDSSDTSPSFSVNVLNGMWTCWHSQRRGDYVLFRAIMDAEEFDEHGRAVVDYSRTQRALLQEHNLVHPINLDWLRDCQVALRRELLAVHQIQQFKPWTLEGMVQYGIGYDPVTDRYIFPVYDRWGEIINCRIYNPNAIPKMIWGNSGMSANSIWPRQGWDDQSVILVEGETDALSLRCLGLAGVSGTMGASVPVPDGYWYTGKTVYILMDVDAAGESARAEAVRRLSGRCGDLRNVFLPEWEGRPEKADVTNYIQYLYSQGHSFQEVQNAIIQLLNNGEEIADSPVLYDQDAEHRSFSAALSGSNLNQRLSFISRVTARSPSRYIVPSNYVLSCPAQGHTYCRGCPMNEVHHGEGRFRHDPRSIETLKIIQASDEKKLETLKSINDVPLQCPDVILNVLDAYDIETVIINASVSEGVASTDEIERQRREAYIILRRGEIPKENKDYEMQGFVYPHPSSQQGVFLIDQYNQHAGLSESHIVTPEVTSRMREIFSTKPGQTVYEKLVETADDMASSITLIYDRQDLHLAYRTVWHTALEFNLCGALVERGWAECLVLGDTRCGKSKAFQRMSHFYGLGILVDCKLQSAAGMMGAVMQAATGEYYVVAGILPQQDGGIVCLDEFHVPKWQGGGIIEQLSSTRSEGIVRVSKAASAEFRARVRSIWLANPGSGKLMKDIGRYGCELAQKLIAQPEDIARFDFAVTVTQDEVDPDEMNIARRPTVPFHDQVDSRALLSWTYSRTPDQIMFSNEAEDRVMELSKQLYKKYSAAIPFVEPADQRNKVAKIAVSVAAQVFSASEDGHFLLVLPQHVDAAFQLLTRWYDKPSMGYDKYSKTQKRESSIVQEDAIMAIMQKISGNNVVALASSFLSMEKFTERMFYSLVRSDGLSNFGLLSSLITSRCVSPMRQGDLYELTPAFVRYLRCIQEGVV